MKKPLPILKMPLSLRRTLSIPQGDLYVSSKGIVRGIRGKYAVGDYVSMTLRYDVNIIDYKTRRKERIETRVNQQKTTTINPPGTLSLMSRSVLKEKAVRTFIVEGEEDLLPILIGLEDNGDILYGQPRIGVVRLKTDKLKSQRILKTFKPDIYFL